MSISSEPFSKLIVLILDGWGIAPASHANALTRAKTPCITGLINTYPVTTLKASGESIGLPWEDPGNSEAGHYAIGTGRALYHPLVRINSAIWDGSFFNNRELHSLFSYVSANTSTLHLVGLISAGGVHSYVDHIYALLDMAKRNGVSRIVLHCIVDGPPLLSAEGKLILRHLKERLAGIGIGKIASLHGSIYAMDSDGHWERTDASVKAIIEGESKETFKSSELALNHYYHQEVYDRAIPPTVIVGRNGKPVGKVKAKDGILFFNFRADRTEQLIKTFTESLAEKPKRMKESVRILSFAKCATQPTIPSVFSDTTTHSPFSKIISDAGMRQIHIAETEKYSHITYYFNGARDEPFKGEDDILVPSSESVHYDTVPEMSSSFITEHIIKTIAKGAHDCIVANFANVDMVAHTANLKATISAAETVDAHVGSIMRMALSKDFLVCITSDHGNAETLIHQGEEKLHKDHTRSSVPFILAHSSLEGKTLGFPDAPGGDLSLVRPLGSLLHVAPTLLSLLGITPDKKMEESLVGKNIFTSVTSRAQSHV